MDKRSWVPAPRSSLCPGGESDSAERGGTEGSGVAYKEPQRGGKLRGPEVGFSSDRPGADARAEWLSGREGGRGHQQLRSHVAEGRG